MAEGCTYCIKDAKYMCNQKDGNYSCTRRYTHKGAHFACAGVGFHMLHTWDTRAGTLGIAKGAAFCFTGTLRGMSRRKAKLAVMKAGASHHDSLTAAVDYLVVGNNGAGTAKYRQATIKKVRMLSEKEFIDLIMK